MAEEEPSSADDDPFLREVDEFLKHPEYFQITPNGHFSPESETMESVKRASRAAQLKNGNPNPFGIEYLIGYSIPRKDFAPIDEMPPYFHDNFILDQGFSYANLINSLTIAINEEHEEEEEEEMPPLERQLLEIESPGNSEDLEPIDSMPTNFLENLEFDQGISHEEVANEEVANTEEDEEEDEEEEEWQPNRTIFAFRRPSPRNESPIDEDNVLIEETVCSHETMTKTLAAVEKDEVAHPDGGTLSPEEEPMGNASNSDGTESSGSDTAATKSESGDDLDNDPLFMQILNDLKDAEFEEQQVGNEGDFVFPQLSQDSEPSAALDVPLPLLDLDSLSPQLQICSDEDDSSSPTPNRHLTEPQVPPPKMPQETVESSEDLQPMNAPTTQANFNPLELPSSSNSTIPSTTQRPSPNSAESMDFDPTAPCPATPITDFYAATPRAPPSPLEERYFAKPMNPPATPLSSTSQTNFHQVLQNNFYPSAADVTAQPASFATATPVPSSPMTSYYPATPARSTSPLGYYPSTPRRFTPPPDYYPMTPRPASSTGTQTNYYPATPARPTSPMDLYPTTPRIFTPPPVYHQMTPRPPPSPGPQMNFCAMTPRNSASFSPPMDYNPGTPFHSTSQTNFSTPHPSSSQNSFQHPQMNYNPATPLPSYSQNSSSSNSSCPPASPYPQMNYGAMTPRPPPSPGPQMNSYSATPRPAPSPSPMGFHQMTPCPSPGFYPMTQSQSPSPQMNFPGTPHPYASQTNYHAMTPRPAPSPSQNFFPGTPRPTTSQADYWPGTPRPTTSVRNFCSGTPRPQSPKKNINFYPGTPRPPPSPGPQMNYCPGTPRPATSISNYYPGTPRPHSPPSNFYQPGTRRLPPPTPNPYADCPRTPRSTTRTEDIPFPVDYDPVAPPTSEEKTAKRKAKEPTDDDALFKKPRARFTIHQVSVLTERFEMNPTITAAVAAELERELGMTVKQIKCWFQNRRMAQKKKMSRML